MGQTLSRQMVVGSKCLERDIFVWGKIKMGRTSGPSLGTFTFWKRFPYFSPEDNNSVVGLSPV